MLHHHRKKNRLCQKNHYVCKILNELTDCNHPSFHFQSIPYSAAPSTPDGQSFSEIPASAYMPFLSDF